MPQINSGRAASSRPEGLRSKLRGMLKSLRARLFLGVLVVDLLLGAVFTFSGYRAMQEWVQDSVQSGARAFHQLLVSAAAPLLAELNYGALQELVEQAASRDNLLYVRVRDPVSGRVVAAAGQVPKLAPQAQRPDLETAARSEAVDGAYHFAGPIVLGSQRYGALEFGLSSAVSARAVHSLVTRALTISAVGLLVASLVLLALTGILTRGLSRLADAARSVGAGGRLALLPVKGSDEVAQLSAAFNDMSQRLSERMAALAQSDALQRGVADSLSEAVLVKDASGALVLFNAAAAGILALSPEQLRGDAALPVGWRLCDEVGDRLAPPWPPRLPASAGPTPSAEGLQRPRQLELCLPDGRSRWLTVNVVTLPVADAGILTVCSMADISPFIEAEAALQRSKLELEARVEQRTAELAQARDVAESASSAKSEFLSRMSHELRTPLNAILGFAQMIPAYAGASAKVLTAAQYIERGGWQLLALVDDILDLARIEAGKIRVDLKDTELAEVAEDCVRLVKVQAEAGALTIDNQIPAGLGVVADRVRLEEVLNNLLSNAVKYNRPGGSIGLRAWRRADGRVGISVKDSGIGLSAAQQARLFQPFERLGAEQRGVPGTGIGLVITRRLVDLMGGRLIVQSQPGQGSCFEFDLAPAGTHQLARPVASLPPLPRVPAGDPAMANTPRRRVLYIEDNLANGALMQALLLHRPDLELELAGTGAEGLAMARAQPPALLLVDVRLPDTDGLTLCREARADPHLRQLPIIAVSAQALPADLEQGRAAGFDAYLTKPLQLVLVLDAIDRALGVATTSPSPP